MREVEAGISFCLSLPLDFPGGTALNQRRHPPALAPTEDMDGNPDVFYNVHMSEMPDFGDPKYVDVWADDVVTLSLQYSTQWDSLAHVGAEFDADGDGVEEAVYYNGYRAGTDLVGPERRRRPATAAAHRCFAQHLGLEHMAFHGVQGRGVLVDLAHHLGHDWRGVDLDALLEEIMAADDVVVEPGDMLLLHTGFATKVLEWDRDPDPGRDLHAPAPTSTPGTTSLLEWIADSQISALVADNYAVEGLLGKDRDPSRHSFLPIHHLCLFKLGVPLGEMWYLHELADVAARARPQPLPAHRPAAAPARHRRLTPDPGRHRLTPTLGSSRRALERPSVRSKLESFDPSAISSKSLGRPPVLSR